MSNSQPGGVMTLLKLCVWIGKNILRRCKKINNILIGSRHIKEAEKHWRNIHSMIRRGGLKVKEIQQQSLDSDRGETYTKRYYGLWFKSTRSTHLVITRCCRAGHTSGEVFYIGSTGISDITRWSGDGEERSDEDKRPSPILGAR